MEKIININMAGRVIAIEDNAYTSLKSYLESLSNYFAEEEGRDEIINDIESRIAELMAIKIAKGSVAITTADITEITGSMGSVADFAAAEDEPVGSNVPPTNAYRTSRPKSRRFHRDSNDKILGGVCSGLAAYLNVDPALVRIVFAILLFGGGAGFVLYIALWIFVPSEPLEGFQGRRLFRDSDDKWLGGVCSGIAAYFDREPWIFRLLFAAPFLMSMLSGTFGFFLGTSLFFGSFTGSFILIYIVLWVVLPIATTDFDRMEMRGEKVDLNSIRNNVKADIRDKAKAFGNEVSESATRLKGEARQFVENRGRVFVREARDAARPLASRGGHIIGTIIKAFFTFIGICIAFSLFIVLIAYCFGGVSSLFNEFILRTPAQRTLGWATVFLFFGVPLLALVTALVRRMLRIRTKGRYVALGYSVLWLAGWCCLVVLLSTVGQEFRHREIVRESEQVLQPAGDRLILAAPDQEIYYSNSLALLHGNIGGWDVQDGVMSTANVRIVPELSPDSLYHVQLFHAALGRNAAEAVARAEHFSYSVHRMSDSVLALSSGFTITRQDGYRGQQVIVRIQIPAGKKFGLTKVSRIS